MAYEINDDALYYFLKPTDDKYNTLLVGWIIPELVEGLLRMGNNCVANIKLEIGEQTLHAIFEGPVYLLNNAIKEAHAFVGDDGKLDFFPSGNVPGLDGIDHVIDYPTYWTKEVEPLLEWKFDGNLFRQVDGLWVPVTVTS